MMVMSNLLMNNILQAQFEDIKKIVDQLWENLNENQKKVWQHLIYISLQAAMKMQI